MAARERMNLFLDERPDPNPDVEPPPAPHGLDYTEEEKQVRQRLSATVEANLRSVEEEEQAKRKKLVTFRGIGADVKKAAQETRSTGADKTVVEVPGEKGAEGTVVVFVSTEEGSQAEGKRSSLLVTIPLKSQKAPGK